MSSHTQQQALAAEPRRLDPIAAHAVVPAAELPSADVVAAVPRADEVARRALQDLPAPPPIAPHPGMAQMHPANELPVITTPPESASRVDSVARSRGLAGTKAVSQGPAGRAVAETYQTVEGLYKKKLKENRVSIETSKDKMDDLLRASTQTQKFSSDKDSHDISPELRTTLDGLRNKHGIELLPANATNITKEQLLMMRDHIKSHLDTTKTTEISTKFLDNEMLMSNLKALGDIVQAMIRRSEQADQKAQQHMAQHT